MKSLIRNLFLTTLAIALGVSAAHAAPWPPAKGDLLLGVQAVAGTGTTTNVFFNLGPAHALRDDPNPAGVLVNLDAELTAAFGADWATRTDLYFGVIGVLSKNPPSGLGSAAPVNGDPSRTIYLSKGTTAPGASSPWEGFTTSALGSAANNHHGQVDADRPAINHADIVPNGNQVATVTQGANPVPWNNSWSRWNPVPGPAFAVFTGGIQSSFGNGAVAGLVDLYRIPGTTGDGTYITTIAISDSGDVTAASANGPAPTYYTLTPGTITGPGIVPALIPGGVLYEENSVINLTAQATQVGFALVNWTGDASGSDNPLAVTMDADKTIGATFGKDLTDTDTDGISAFDELTIHNTDPGIPNTPPAFPNNVAHVSTTNTVGGAEISAFDPISDRLFVTQGGGIAVLDLSNPASPTPVATVDFTQAPFNLSGTAVTSVSVKNGVVAAAVVDGVDKNNPGTVVFLNGSTLAHLGSATVGSLPDMVTFTPDGNKVLTANEGEAIDGNGGFGTAKGTVSIIDVSGGFAAAPVTTVDFTSFDGQEAALRTSGVRIFQGESASNDFEPEYVAVSPDSTKAMVTLQENNAVAILDIATATFTAVVPLGEKDFSTLLADFSDRDGPGNSQIGQLTTGNPVFGLYMPDAIDSFESGGQTFYVIANEGDDRDDFLVTEETSRLSGVDLDDTVFPNEADLKQNANLGRLTISNSPGLRGDIDNDGDIDRILAFGGRSFSILDSTGAIVYDSGDITEVAVQSYGLPFFDDGRSDNKGSEPEGVRVGLINGVPKLFVGLERANGVMMFDISTPTAPVFEAFLNQAGDVSPEGLTFIPASDSPTAQALLVVTNEVSETVTVYSFDVPTVNLTLSPTTNGTISGASSGPVPEGDTVNLTAEPAPGFAFTGWTGDASGTTNPLAVLMDVDKTIGATFGPSNTDDDGNGFSEFEEGQLAAVPRRFNVGDTVDIDLSFLDDSTLRILVTGLPKGLTYDPNTQRITGTILAPGSDAGALIRKFDGRRPAGTIGLALSVEEYPFLGTYQGLLESTGGSPLPSGSVKITVNKVGAWTGVLEIQGEPIRRARGTFVNAMAPTQQIVALFANPRFGNRTVTLDLSTGSDLITGTVDATATVRGFRIAKPVRNPGGVVRLSVALSPDVAGDSVNVPAGVGHLSGTINNLGIIRLVGLLGDAQRASVSLCLSQSNQAVLWSTPYRDKASFIGGIFDIGDLGQASRGGAIDGDPNTGIKWFKNADTRERSYPAGFPVQDLEGQTSRWIPVPNATALADSLGLNFREIDAAYTGDANPNLPTKFSLRNAFTLLPVEPFTALRTAVRANRVTGSFAGAMFHPDGRSTVNGVLLQDESFGTVVGTGLVKIPVVGVRGAFRTVGVEMTQTP